MKESLIPNAQNALLQSRSITPPVNGMISGDELDCDVEDEDCEVEAGGVELGEPGGRVGMTTVVSTTVTLKLPKAILPAASLAEQLTVVAPTLKDAPEAGTQFAEVEP